MDEIYAALIVRPLLWISTNVLWHVVDEGVIDGVVNGSAHVAREAGGKLRELQSGNARSYATWVVIGAVGFTVLLVGLWLRCASVDMQSHLLTVITFFPLLGVPALLLLRSEDHVWIRRIALAVSLAEFALSLFLLPKFDATSARYQFEEYLDWIGRAKSTTTWAWTASACFSSC